MKVEDKDLEVQIELSLLAEMEGYAEYCEL